MIATQDTSESLPTLDGTIHNGLIARLLDQLVVESLVIALKVICNSLFLVSPLV